MVKDKVSQYRHKEVLEYISNDRKKGTNVVAVVLHPTVLKCTFLNLW